MQLNIQDDSTQNINSCFEEASNFIKEGIENGGCLVHCAFGISRSASLVIAYLMRDKNWKFDETFKYVLEKRKIIAPNCGFQDELRQYEIDLGLSTKEDLLEYYKKPNYYFSKYA